MKFKFPQLVMVLSNGYRFVITSEFHSNFDTILKMATLDFNNKKNLAMCLKNASKQNRDIGKTSSQRTLYLLVYRKCSFKYRSFYFYFYLISTKTILIILQTASVTLFFVGSLSISNLQRIFKQSTTESTDLSFRQLHHVSNLLTLFLSKSKILSYGRSRYTYSHIKNDKSQCFHF